LSKIANEILAATIAGKHILQAYVGSRAVPGLNGTAMALRHRAVHRTWTIGARISTLNMTWD
jgi:hypothetical protein